MATVPVWDLLLGDGGSVDATGIPALSGPENMALDELLLRRVRDGGRPVLRLYGWQPACLSLGRNQPARGLLDAGIAARKGVDIVRRPTGGLAVLHERELTYAVAVPVGVLGSPRETYRRLSAALAAALERLGVAAEVVSSRSPAAVRAPGSGPQHYLGTAALEARCFGTAAPGEVAVGGRKLVGSAQRREGRVLLQHGSILLEEDQDDVFELFGDEAVRFTGNVDRPATLGGLLGSVPAEAALVHAMVAGVEDTIGIRLADSALSPEDRERLPALVERYGSPEWTWRR